MEFDATTWRSDPASRWLVKTGDERVHAGTIRHYDDDLIELDCADRTVHLAADQVEWIRPLIELATNGWTMVAGFQAEDTTFDTWWSDGEVLLRINYSDPIGFSDLIHVIDQAPGAEAVVGPSLEAQARLRAQLKAVLDQRRHLAVPPLAHLQ